MQSVVNLLWLRRWAALGNVRARWRILAQKSAPCYPAVAPSRISTARFRQSAVATRRLSLAGKSDTNETSPAPLTMRALSTSYVPKNYADLLRCVKQTLFVGQQEIDEAWVRTTWKS